MVSSRVQFLLVDISGRFIFCILDWADSCDVGFCVEDAGSWSAAVIGHVSKLLTAVAFWNFGGFLCRFAPDV